MAMLLIWPDKRLLLGALVRMNIQRESFAGGVLAGVLSPVACRPPTTSRPVCANARPSGATHRSFDVGKVVAAGAESKHRLRRYASLVSDRLAAMGYNTGSPGRAGSSSRSYWRQVDPEEITAAEYYFRSLPEDFIAKMQPPLEGTDQRIPGASGIRSCRKRARDSASWKRKANRHRLSLEEQWERARCLAETGDSLTAVPVLRGIDQARSQTSWGSLRPGCDSARAKRRSGN